MCKSRESLLVFGIALLTYVLLATVAVQAIPPDPTEGELENEEHRNGYGWYLGAYVWGYWTWIPGNPGTYKFVDEYVLGQRYATYGVCLEGNLMCYWGYDSTSYNESKNALVIEHSLTVTCDSVYCQSISMFSFLGIPWIAETDLAQINI